MSLHTELVESILVDIRAARPPKSIAEAFDRLNRVSLGMQLKVPALTSGARLFRVRKMPEKPKNVKEIGAPPLGVAPVGRLNDQGQSVLYSADSPDTAFAEARAESGDFCLAEWRTNQQTIALANGGFDRQSLATFFPNELALGGTQLGGSEDQFIVGFFASVFTLPVMEDPEMYWWSIACGLANGFSHVCERTESKLIDGNTRWTGRFPLAGIAYPSTRKDKKAVNFAWNDRGQTYLELNHVQWVRREIDGSFTGTDIATSWGSDGDLDWAGRAPNFVLESGQTARLTKTGTNIWSYENIDGSLPTFR